MAEKRKTEEKLSRQEGELSFVRAQYQNASSAAAELASELQELKVKAADAERRASGEAGRLKQMHIDKVTEVRKIENIVLKKRLRDLEELLRRKEDELKALKGRGALGTRGTSVPRSPRIPANGGSRGVSPVPGMKSNLHPLRNG